MRLHLSLSPVVLCPTLTDCPVCSGPSSETPGQKIDYEFAQQELMMQEMSNDPIQTAIEEIEKSHEKDKEGE